MIQYLGINASSGMTNTSAARIRAPEASPQTGDGGPSLGIKFAGRTRIEPGQTPWARGAGAKRRSSRQFSIATDTKAPDHAHTRNEGIRPGSGLEPALISCWPDTGSGRHPVPDGLAAPTPPLGRAGDLESAAPPGRRSLRHWWSAGTKTRPV